MFVVRAHYSRLTYGQAVPSNSSRVYEVTRAAVALQLPKVARVALVKTLGLPWTSRYPDLLDGRECLCRICGFSVQRLR